MFTYADRSLWIVELRVNAYDFMNSTTFERPMKNRHRSLLKCEESTCCRIENFSGCYKLRDSLFLFVLDTSTAYGYQMAEHFMKPIRY